MLRILLFVRVVTGSKDAEAEVLGAWADPKDMWDAAPPSSPHDHAPASAVPHAAAAAPPPASNKSGSGNRAAVLLASHAGPMVVSSVLNALGVLPPRWRVHIFASTPAVRLALARVKQLRGRAPRLSIGVLRPQGGVSVHNRPAMLTSQWFWQQCPAELLLLIDETTRLCSHSPKTVDDFADLGLDYIGAPWSDLQSGSALERGGNGMLSLRRRSAMLGVLARHTWHAGDGNEDMWYAEKLFAMKDSKLPTPVVAAQFAVETVFNANPAGVSYAMRTLTTQQRGVILANCPEARVLAGYLPGASWLSDVRSGGVGATYSLCEAQQHCCGGKTEIHWRSKKTVALPPCPID